MASAGMVCETPLGERGQQLGWRLTSPAGRLTADVAPDLGGVLSSLRLGDRELLYRANQFDPPPAGEWSGRAPLLWPAVGRNFTPEQLAREDRQCCFEWDGQVYDLPIHGFARDLRWTTLAAAADGAAPCLTLGLADDETTLAVYPWPFQLRASYSLTDTALDCTVTVSSPVDLPFCIGNHITLALPADGFTACRVACSATARLGLTPASLLSGTDEPIDLSDRSLADERLHNGVFGRVEPPAFMAVTYPDGLRVRVSQEVGAGAELVRPEDVLFVVYANPALSYFCPEPWIGRPNSLQDKSGLVTLPAGALFSWTMRVAVEG